MGYTDLNSTIKYIYYSSFNVYSFLDSPGCGAINTCKTNCGYPKAFLMTPGFPSYYQPNDTCLWKIRGTFGKFIKFNFITLDVINGDSTCEKSYVQIFELDLLNKKRSLGRFCKENWPYEVFTSNWQKLDIEFEASSTYLGGRGFMGKYTMETFEQGPFINKYNIGNFIKLYSISNNHQSRKKIKDNSQIYKDSTKTHR